VAKATQRKGGRSSATGNATEKTLRVLEAAAAPDGPHRLADIAARSTVAKASAHRLLVMLATDGYVIAAGSGRYGVGPRLRTLAAQVAADDRLDVTQHLRDLQQAVGGHTVHLALRNGNQCTYIHKVDGNQPYQMASRIGMSIPLHCTAVGKALLASLPAEEVGAIVASAGLPARTPATITDLGRLDAELAFVRERGYAVDDEENEATVRCIGAPVVDLSGRPIGGVSVTTVTFVVPREHLESFAPDLLAAATKISQALANSNT
jgi:IclR family transcriptional regulator, acetate operon repressor